MAGRCKGVREEILSPPLSLSHTHTHVALPFFLTAAGVVAGCGGMAGDLSLTLSLTHTLSLLFSSLLFSSLLSLALSLSPPLSLSLSLSLSQQPAARDSTDWLVKGAKVEVKWGDDWWQATIKRVC